MTSFSKSGSFSIAGPKGERGWTGVTANVPDGARVVQQVIEWIGGEGTKPALTPALYVSPTGFTSVIANATDIRGATGLTGPAVVTPQTFKNNWNASTNSPTLTTTPSANGDYYIVSVAGTQSITGSSVAFSVGDWVVSNGSAWVKTTPSLTPGPNTVTYDKQGFFMARLAQRRAMTLNIQTKVLSWVTLTTLVDNKVVFITGSTLDVTTALATNPTALKICYYDPTPVTGGVKFGDYNSFSNAACLILFYYNQGVLHAANPESVALVNSSGIEVSTLFPNTVSYTEQAYVVANLAQDRAITLNAQTKVLSWNLLTLIMGKQATFVSASTLDVTTALATNPAALKTCYYNPSNTSINFGDYNTFAANCLILFYYYAGVVYAPYREAIVLIDANGDEQGPGTRGYLNQGDESKERIVLPDTMYFVQGEKLPVYKSSVLGSRDYADLVKLALINSSSTAVSFSYVYEDYQLDPAVLNSTFQFGLRTNYNANYAYLKTITKAIRAASAVSGMNKTFMAIGDSLIENGVPVNIKTKMATYSATLTVAGTRGTTSSEGRGGWQLSNFIGANNQANATTITRMADGTVNTNVNQNPFLKLADSTDKTNYPQFCFRNTGAAAELSYQTDSDKTGNFYIFDFAWYLSNRSITTPDALIVALGTNDLSFDSSTGNLTKMEANLDFLIRQVAAGAPACKIGVTMPVVASTVVGNAQWRQYRSVWLDRMTTKVRTLQGTFSQLATLPVWAHMNPDFGFIYTAQADLNSYNNSKKAQKTDALHFDTFGRIEYAAAVSAWLVNVL